MFMYLWGHHRTLPNINPVREEAKRAGFIPVSLVRDKEKHRLGENHLPSNLTKYLRREGILRVQGDPKGKPSLRYHWHDTSKTEAPLWVGTSHSATVSFSKDDQE